MAGYDKVIVTNAGVMASKYGKQRTKVWAAVDDLIKADQGRDVSSIRIDLDSPKTMKRYGGSPVTDPASPRQNKDAVDAVCKALEPDYVLILGGPDVITHSDLKNPVFNQDDDTDRFAWGDLPYACSSSYSRSIASFRHPTRVVGRLPDVYGETDPAYMLRLLKYATNYKMRPRSDYEGYLGITASTWEGSTTLSLTNLFGNSTRLQISPPKGPAWPKSLLSTRAHFINCHGDEVSPQYFGESKKHAFPVAHDASYIRRSGNVSEGTIVAAECCYGAQLYDPRKLSPAEMGICNRYLFEGAYGFFGSSTIAYGPSDGNGSADLICQYFLDRVLHGASIGRAALEARIQFIQSTGVLDPVDLKTLGQFSLMGDPSLQPVARAKSGMAGSKAFAQAFAAPARARKGRSRRREWLIRNAHAIGQSVGFSKPAPAQRPSAKVAKILIKAVRETGMRSVAVSSHSIEDPFGRGIAESGPRPTRASRIHLAIGSRPGPGASKSSVKGRLRARQVTVVVATMNEAGVARMRRVHSR